MSELVRPRAAGRRTHGTVPGTDATWTREMPARSARRCVRAGAAVAAALLMAANVTAATAATGATAATDTLYLPPPTGRKAVGSTSLHLTDASRPDPWVPGVNRELMVTVWYPTGATSGKRALYMTPEESRIFLESRRLTDLPPDILSTVRTNAYVDAKPAGRAHSLPLVVLSPGHTKPRGTLSGLAEDLASHGYVVVGIDHTHETYAVTFPGGRIATCVACAVDHEPGFRLKQHRTRAADVSFVLDELTGRNPAWRGARLIDASRIGMSGHSSGGASAIPAMVGDNRIDAGINMDGTTSDVIPAAGLSRPFMFLGQPEHSPGGPDTTWDHAWNGMTGWKRWLVVAGTVHSSSDDTAVLAEQLGIESDATITGARAMEIVRRYNLAMFDLHLRHQPQRLLDGPSSRYPEVTIAAR